MGGDDRGVLCHCYAIVGPAVPETAIILLIRLHCYYGETMIFVREELVK